MRGDAPGPERGEENGKWTGRLGRGGPFYLPAFPGISVRTLHNGEQGRRTPSGPAKTLLAIALAHPEILRDIAAP